MRITKVRLQEENPMAGDDSSWPMEIVDLHVDSNAGQNGFLLKNSKGLEPPEIVQIVDGFDIYGTPNYDDVARDRLLVFRIGINPGVGQTFSGLRDQLYRFIGRTVIIKFMDESKVVAVAVGYISKPEAEQFTNRPEVQLTIQCDTGELCAPEPINIPLSILNSDQPKIPYHEGSAPAGLELKFTTTAVRSSFQIFNHNRVRRQSATQTYNMFKVTYPFLVGDQIFVETQFGIRRVYLVRGGVETDLAGYLNAGAVWPKLYSGVTTFDWDIRTTWMTWNYARYTPRYWGV